MHAILGRMRVDSMTCTAHPAEAAPQTPTAPASATSARPEALHTAAAAPDTASVPGLCTGAAPAALPAAEAACQAAQSALDRAVECWAAAALAGPAPAAAPPLVSEAQTAQSMERAQYETACLGKLARAGARVRAVLAPAAAPRGEDAVCALLALGAALLRWQGGGAAAAVAATEGHAARVLVPRPQALSNPADAGSAPDARACCSADAQGGAELRAVKEPNSIAGGGLVHAVLIALAGACRCGMHAAAVSATDSILALARSQKPPACSAPCEGGHARGRAAPAAVAGCCPAAAADAEAACAAAAAPPSGSAAYPARLQSAGFAGLYSAFRQHAAAGMAAAQAAAAAAAAAAEAEAAAAAAASALHVECAPAPPAEPAQARAAQAAAQHPRPDPPGASVGAPAPEPQHAAAQPQRTQWPGGLPPLAPHQRGRALLPPQACHAVPRWAHARIPFTVCRLGCRHQQYSGNFCGFSTPGARCSLGAFRRYCRLPGSPLDTANPNPVRRQKRPRAPGADNGGAGGQQRRPAARRARLAGPGPGAAGEPGRRAWPRATRLRAGRLHRAG
jgi:hypothetical protein